MTASLNMVMIIHYTSSFPHWVVRIIFHWWNIKHVATGNEQMVILFRKRNSLYSSTDYAERKHLTLLHGTWTMTPFINSQLLLPLEVIQYMPHCHNYQLMNIHVQVTTLWGSTTVFFGFHRKGSHLHSRSECSSILETQTNSTCPDCIN